MVAWGRALAVVALLTLGLVAAGPARGDGGSGQILDEWRTWPYQSECGGVVLSPIAVFSTVAGAEEGSLPAEVGLREVVNDPALSWIGFAQHGWRALAEGPESASFVSGELGEDTRFLSLTKADGRWKFAGSGPCSLTTVVPGARTVAWSLAAEQPGLRPDTRRIRVDLGPGNCASGASQNARARKPIFRQRGRTLLMILSLEFGASGPQTCQGVIEPPLRVSLPGRLGTRKLYDAGSFPPRPAAETRPPGPLPR
jgi:hypothetical protein